MTVGREHSGDKSFTSMLLPSSRHQHIQEKKITSNTFSLPRRMQLRNMVSMLRKTFIGTRLMFPDLIFFHDTRYVFTNVDNIVVSFLVNWRTYDQLVSVACAWHSWVRRHFCFLEFGIVVSRLYSILIVSTTMAHVSATNHEPMFYHLSVKSNYKKFIQLS